MTVDYRVWFKDRENHKSRLQLIITVFGVEDLMLSAHDLMIKQSDYDWECYRVDLVSIEDFVH